MAKLCVLRRSCVALCKLRRINGYSDVVIVPGRQCYLCQLLIITFQLAKIYKLLSKMSYYFEMLRN